MNPKSMQQDEPQVKALRQQKTKKKAFFPGPPHMIITARTKHDACRYFLTPADTVVI